jgi:glutamate synthase domain-containing protein 3
VRIKLTGESNDYVGKGMNGGEIILVPSPSAKFDPAANSICGNTVLYGATGGALFIRGRAGERFAVRNSGATAVVEGVGDHGCEYMTNGCVIVLGVTGKNFAAGMSGGVAYIYDAGGTFQTRCNHAMVKLERLSAADEIKMLRGIIYRHLEATDSARAREILDDWSGAVGQFWKLPSLPKTCPPVRPICRTGRRRAPGLRIAWTRSAVPSRSRLVRFLQGLFVALHDFPRVARALADAVLDPDRALAQVDNGVGVVRDKHRRLA